MNNIKVVTGPLKHDMIPQQAEELGAGKFLFRLHILPEKKDSVRVWVSLLPGTQESQGERMRLLLGHPSFPAPSYELSNKTNKDKKRAALRPKATNQKMGPFFLGLLENSLAVVDPMSYLTSIKGLLRKGLWPNKSLGPALPAKLQAYKGNMRFYAPTNNKRRVSTPPRPQWRTIPPLVSQKWYK